MYHDKLKRIYSTPIIKEFKHNQLKKIKNLAIKKKQYNPLYNPIPKNIEPLPKNRIEPLLNKYTNSDKPYINEFNKDIIKKSNKLYVNTKKKKARIEYYRPKNFDEYRYEKYRKSKYIYIPMNDIPKMGWLQSCIMCYNMTSNIIKKDDDYIYVCNRCNKKIPQIKIKSKANKIKNHNFY